MLGSMPEPVANLLPVQNSEILPVHQVPQKLLQIQLNKLDLIAAKRVRDEEHAPGPFGAATMVYNIRTGKHFIIGDRWDSNRVNADGPQAHAEAVNVYPDRVADLKAFLDLEKNDPDWVVVFLSTGESCPSCFTKQHVIVNELIQSGLIEKGRVLNFYGADYDMTQAVAGFSDKDQLIDMVENPNGAPLTHGKMNCVGTSILDLPTDVQDIFRQSQIPVAVLMKDGQVFATGYDTRVADNDPLATAEMNAVKAASEKKRGIDPNEAWDLSDLQIVSATPLARAPLARTAMFWGSIGVGLQLRDSYMEALHPKLITVEERGMTNEQLYAAATDRPYNGPNSMIHCFQAQKTGPSRFRNLAQQAWGPRVERDAEKGRNIHYDGGQQAGHGPSCKC